MAGKEHQETDEEKATREAAEEKAFEERVSKLVGPIINKAVTSQLARATKASDAKFDAIMAKLGGAGGGEETDEQREAREAAEAEAAAAGGGERQRGTDGKLKAKQDPEVTARLARLEASDKANKKRAEDAEKKNAEMEASRKVNEENDLSTKTLLGLGIKDEVQLESALLFHRGKGRIVRDPETGKPLFKRVDKDGDDEFVPLEAGLKDWGKSDEAKRFLPPTGGGGGGSQGGSAGAGKSKDGKYGDSQFAADIAAATGFVQS